MNRVDVGYYLDYCGHRVLKNVTQICNTRTNKHLVFIDDDETQYALKYEDIEFVVPHEEECQTERNDE